MYDKHNFTWGLTWARWLWWCWGHCHIMVNTIVFWDNHVFFFSWIPTLGFDDSTFTIDYSLLPTSGSPIRNLQLYILRIHVVFYTLQLPISTIMYLSSFLGYHFFLSGFSFVFCSITTSNWSFAFGFYFIWFFKFITMQLRRIEVCNRGCQIRDTDENTISSHFTDNSHLNKNAISLPWR